MTNEEKLKKQLHAAMQALAEIEGRASRLDARVSKRQLSEHSAFYRLVGCIQSTVQKTREEVNND